MIVIDVSVAEAHVYDAKWEFLRKKQNVGIQDFINLTSCKILPRLGGVSASSGRFFSTYLSQIVSLNYAGARQTLALDL